MKNKTEAELKYIIKDAAEAAKNMKGMDDKAEGKYLDQVNDASTELYRRKKAAKKTVKKEGALFQNVDILIEALDGMGSAGLSVQVKKEMKLKSGVIIPIGTQVTCQFDEANTSGFTLSCDLLEKPMRMPYQSAHAYLTKFKAPPSDRALEKMTSNGIVTTPLGGRTEPDGTGLYGEPSWLLVMGLI